MQTASKHRQSIGVVLSLTATIFGATLLRAQQPGDVFPTEKGTYWIYRGEVKWEKGPGEVSARNLDWKMEVLDSVDRPGFSAILLRGHPSDLAWYTPQTTPGDSLLVQIGRRFYFVTGRGAAQTLQLFRTTESVETAKNLVDDSDIWFALPLKVGEKFCDPELPPRQDTDYCWYVEEERPADLKTVKGIPEGSFHEFKLAFRTNPEHEFIGFVPGIGIASYDYGHHGTVSEAHMRLAEFGHAGPIPQH